LVLGGGGSAGNAWLIGVIAGLFDAGLDVTEVDLIIGTSAGSTAAAQITSASPTQLLADILSAAPQQRTGPVGSDRGRVPIGPLADHMERTSRIIAAAEDPADMRRRMGAAALEMDAASDGAGQTRWRATVAARLPSQRWPERTVLITAVDAHTGEPSCSTATAESTWWTPSPPAVPAASPTVSATADTSTAATDDPARMPIWQPDTAGAGAVTTRRQNTGAAGVGHASCSTGRRTTRRGSRVETVLPDSDSRNAFGSNLMDLSTRPPAARAGYDQGGALAEQLTGFWR
jgi:NTE family protein